MGRYGAVSVLGARENGMTCVQNGAKQTKNAVERKIQNPEFFVRFLHWVASLREHNTQ